MTLPLVHDAEERVAVARLGLTEKLVELQHRVDRARTALSPAHVLKNPWLRLGAALVVGYTAGSMTRASVLRAVSRKLVLFAATAIVRDVLRSSEA